MIATIRALILGGLYLRAGAISTDYGFATSIGDNVFRGKAPGKALPAITINPGAEGSERNYNGVLNEMAVTVAGFLSFAPTVDEPTLIAELILADLIEAFTGTEFTIGFSGGSEVIQTGDVITGEDSGASGYVARAVVLSGSWAGGDAAGSITIRRPVEVFQTGEVIRLDSQAAAVVTTVAGVDPLSNSTSGFADSISYAEGGAANYPDNAETVVGCSATFRIKYKTKYGDPYSQ